MERRLLWNYRINNEDQNVEWYFVIINSLRETEDIQTKIVEHLHPVDEFQSMEGNFKKSRYRIFQFLSPKGEDSLRLDEIYQGEKRRERKLYPRQTGGLSALKDSILQYL
jgi:hypothetical protein